jgi:membrane associated rhomboid family serine protease
MFERKRTGSILCPSCGKLVGVNDEVCLSCGRKKPGMWGLTSVFRKLGQDLGFVQIVIAGTAFLYLAMLAVDPGGIRMNGIFAMGAPSQESLIRFGAAGRFPVWIWHHWWTVLSAGWLHAGLLHIGFNLYWIRILAPEVAELYGAGRMVILYTISSIVGFFVSSSIGVFVPFFSGSMLTVGASAPILGLLGALVHYGRRTGSSVVGRQAWSYAIYMLALGFLMSGLGVDNWAHIGGFAGGYLASMLVDPRKRETGNHLALALVCLLLTLASIVASLVVPLPR